MATISAVLVVKDAGKCIEQCLRSLRWADEIVVVDGGSTDQTIAIVRKYTEKVYERSFDNFSAQKNEAIGRATGEWILSIDADEVVTEALQESLREAAQDKRAFDGYFLRRRTFVFGKELKFGGQGREKLLRFFRRRKGRFEQPIHERLVVEGRLGELRGDLLHYSSATVEEYLRKLRLYTDLEARWMAEKGIRPTLADLYLKPKLRFLYFYLLRGGFLDGYEGFLYHFLSSFYYFFKYVRLEETLSGRAAERT
jgi:glycosyltransferase involved in cell wall biosynthesis